MKIMKKNGWATLVLVVAMLMGMMTFSFARDDFESWKSDYDNYGYDPYEQYYEAWGVPTILEIFEKNGQKAADNYVGLFRMAVRRNDPTLMQKAAAEVDEVFPPDQNTPDPSVPAVKETKEPSGGGAVTGKGDDYWSAIDGGGAMMGGIDRTGTARYEQWTQECAAQGYDTYEQYYEMWDIPSVTDFYESNGIYAANEYIRRLKISIEMMGDKACAAGFKDVVDTKTGGRFFCLVLRRQINRPHLF